MDIGTFQLEASQAIHKYFEDLKKKNINIGKSSYTFMATWGDNVGFEYLKYKILKTSNILNFLKLFFKDLHSAISISNFEILNSFNINNKKKIIFSNASSKDFNSDGSYNDRYFKINSDQYNEFIFILVYSDHIVPTEISSNILLLRLKQKFSFKKLFIFFWKYLNTKLNKKYFFHQYSNASRFSEELFIILKKNINLAYISRIFLPYEGIPFQQYLSLELKKINENIKIIGYDHSAPHAVPFNMFFRQGSPDLLLVNGESQKNYLTNYLNWPKDQIEIAPSLRYKKNSKEKFENIIFFPWKITNEKIILRDLKFLLESFKSNSLSKFLVKTHPTCSDPKKQKKLKIEIESLLKIYEDKFNDNKDKTSIFIGSTTGVIVALEKGLDVIHICFDPLFESYSSKMWPELNVTSVSRNTFIYKLKKKQSFINFGENDETFNKFYNK